MERERERSYVCGASSAARRGAAWWHWHWLTMRTTIQGTTALWHTGPPFSRRAPSATPSAVPRAAPRASPSATPCAAAAAPHARRRSRPDHTKHVAAMTGCREKTHPVGRFPTSSTVRSKMYNAVIFDLVKYIPRRCCCLQILIGL